MQADIKNKTNRFILQCEENKQDYEPTRYWEITTDEEWLRKFLMHYAKTRIPVARFGLMGMDGRNYDLEIEAGGLSTIISWWGVFA